MYISFCLYIVSIYLFIYLSLYLFLCLPTYLLTYIFIPLSLYQLPYLLTYLSISLPISLSTISIPSYLSIYPFLFLHPFLFLYLLPPSHLHPTIPHRVPAVAVCAGRSQMCILLTLASTPFFQDRREGRRKGGGSGEEVKLCVCVVCVYGESERE